MQNTTFRDFCFLKVLHKSWRELLWFFDLFCTQLTQGYPHHLSSVQSLQIMGRLTQNFGSPSKTQLQQQKTSVSRAGCLFSAGLLGHNDIVQRGELFLFASGFWKVDKKGIYPVVLRNWGRGGRVHLCEKSWLFPQNRDEKTCSSPNLLSHYPSA